MSARLAASKHSTDSIELPCSDKKRAAWLGVLFLLIAAFLVVIPPARVRKETSSTGQVSTIESPAETNHLALAAGVAGAVFLLYCVNGLRLTKFNAGGVGAEAETRKPVQAKLDEDLGQHVAKIEAPEVSVEDGDAAVDPEDTVKASDGDDYDTYSSIGDVPFAVVEALVTKWPGTVPKPTDLSKFEYATRRRGKGNHAWLLKFSERSLIQVSYGGQGKPGATVSEAQ